VKLVLSIVAAVGFASIAVAVYIAHRVSEPTVVRDPYEEGLHYDDHRHASDPTGGKREARKASSTPSSTSNPTATSNPTRSCDLQAGPCTRPLPDGGEITLSVGPRPLRAMTDVEFTLSVSPASAAAGGAATVALSMPHMYMGETRVALARAGDGVFHGKGVLVRCASGRRDWAADVKIERAGAPAITARFPLVVAAE
jgi:hypothetical protein